MSKPRGRRSKFFSWLEKLKYHILLPSILTWVIMRSLLFLVIFSITMLIVMALVLDAAKEGELNSGLGRILFTSFAAVTVNFLGCSLLALTFVGLGRELRDFSLFRMTKLWPLAFRMLAVPILVAVVLAPAMGPILVSVFDVPVKYSWLFGINLAMMHVMFCVGAVFVVMIPTVNRFARWAILALFPFRVIGNLIPVLSFWALFLFAHLLRAIFENHTEAATQLLNFLASLVDLLISVPIIGPLLVFWINPYYLLLRLHTGYEFGLAASASFGLACLLATVAMGLRLRYWLNVDLDERSVLIYEDWLEWRQSIPLNESPPTMEMPEWVPHVERPAENVHPEDEEVESVSDLQPEVSKAGETRFVLPDHLNGDIYIFELTAQKGAYPNKTVLFTGAGLALSAVLVTKWMLFVAWVAWLTITIVSPWPVSRASLIMPQKMTSALSWVVRRKIMPLLPVDGAFAVVTTVVFNLSPVCIIAFAGVFIGARFLALCVQIGYALQSLGVVLFTLLCCLVYTMTGISTMLTVAESKGMRQLMTFAGICVASVLLAWLNLLWVQWRTFRWLQHKANP